MRGRPINYSPEELAFIKKNCTLVIGDLHKAFREKFQRNDVSASNINSLRKRNGWRTGRTGQFEKGHDGYKGGPGGPNATSFKKGSVPANLKPLYSERITKLGYIEIKVPEENPYTGSKTRYRLKHQWVWEQHNGKVPEGHILHFVDGDKLNCSIENLEIFPRGVGAIMNKKQHSSQPEELKPIVKNLAKLQYRQHELQQERK